MKIDVLYEDENLLVIDKPAGLTVLPEGKTNGKTLKDYLLEKYPYLKELEGLWRWGIVHRLDKDTSGILLVAKNKNSYEFLQKQFQEKKVTKRYLALVMGNIKEEEKEKIETLIGRSSGDRRKQKVYLPNEPGANDKRTAITEYKVLKNFENYTLIEVSPKTGRKHQIRTHLAFLHHPIAGDKLYSFKNQITPPGLKRQFLHASYLKIKLPDNNEKEFESDLAEDLKDVIKKL
jgi:23S rRNA pseudouridine1911/1915/1917 synthase